MRYLAGILVIFAFPGVSGWNCTSSDSEPALAVSESLYFESVGFGQAGSLSDTTEVVLRDSSAWVEMASKLAPREAFGSVDFSQYMVMLVALPQVSGGFRIEFQSVEKQDGDITASYVVSAPGGDCLTIAALTLPFQAVAVRQADGDVSFERSVIRESCSVD
ncbi:MAG: hypothetical protein KJO98_03795 [Rhodothermia bacterium]|nr:hypothetical protein [Rhodothermia bacterium]